MPICSVCEQHKEKELFVLRKDRKSKFRNTCKKCARKRQRELYYERKRRNPFIFKHQKLSVSAKQRGIDYNLDPEFLKSIWTGFCPISGEQIFISTNAKDRGNDNSAELDRFIPEKGYTKGNVSWISRKFNRKKLDSSIEELKMIVEWLETYQPKVDGFCEIDKVKQTPWNKGLKTPGVGFKTGKDNPTSRLTEEQVLVILKTYRGERGQIAELSRDYAVSPATIRKIVKRETWKHLKV